MEMFGNIKTYDISNIGRLPCAPKAGSVNFPEKYLHILTKVSTEWT